MENNEERRYKWNQRILLFMLFVLLHLFIDRNVVSIYKTTTTKTTTTTTKTNNQQTVHDNSQQNIESQTSNHSNNKQKIMISNNNNQNSNSKTKFLHVVNPFEVHNDNNNNNNQDYNYHPLDLTQYITLQSIYLAKQNATTESTNQYYEVTLACGLLSHEFIAKYNDDYNDNNNGNILKRNGCDLIYRVNRSTATEYSNFLPINNNNKQLPFIKDLLSQALMAVSTTTTTTTTTSSNNEYYDYLIYTNIDIGLVADFYSQIENLIQEYNLQALSVNRRDIRNATDLLQSLNTKSNDDNNNNMPSSNIEKTIIAKKEWIHSGKIHPGYDCFIFHVSIVPIVIQYLLGDLFLGYPPWGTALHIALETSSIMQNVSYRNFKSIKDLTFHLGVDNGNWIQANNDNNNNNPSLMYNVSESEYEYLKQYCPNTGSRHINIFRYQNTKNCAMVFEQLQS